MPTRARRGDRQIQRHPARIQHDHPIRQHPASATSCVTRTAVKPCACQIRPSSCCISIRVNASSAPKGSSNANTLG